jgi:hypothetical protein
MAKCLSVCVMLVASLMSEVWTLPPAEREARDRLTAEYLTNVIKGEQKLPEQVCRTHFYMYYT